MDESVEIQKIKLEEHRLEQEMQLKKMEIELRHIEIDLQRKQYEDSQKEKGLLARIFSPVGIAVIVGLIGLLGTAAGGLINVYVESKKQQAGLILKMSEIQDEKQRALNLLFFAKGGYLTFSPEYERYLRQQAGLGENEQIPPPSFVPNTATSREIFFNRYKYAFGVPLSKEGRAALQQIFDFIKEDKDIKDIRYVAYILATIQHETAGTYQPSVELYGKKQRYAPYYGRGYILLTWEHNYRKMNEVLGLVNTDNDLVRYPDKALNPQIAYRIMAYGMQNGTFTNRKLSDFIAGDKADYFNARRIINGLDQAAQIANAAKKFETVLRDSLGSNRKN